MVITENQLNQLKNSITSTLSPVLAIAGVANPISASILFGVDIIFRFVTLGTQIRKSLEDANDKLDKEIRAEGIFRIPIQVDMTFSEVLGFFTKGNCQLLYPIAYNQFKREREIIVDQTHPEWQEAFRTLVLAYRILPEVYFDYKFDNSPVLDDLFGKWLDPGNPDFHSLIKEMEPFLSKEETSLGDLMKLLPEYSRMKLQLMGVKLDSLTQGAVEKVNEAIQDLVWSAVLGDPGMVKTTTDFVEKRYIEHLDSQLAELNERKTVLEDKPETERIEADKKEMKQIEQRIEEIKKMKERIKPTSA